MKKFIKLIKEKWLKQTSLTLLLVAIILAIFLVVNGVLEKLDIAPIDFTKEKIYSLSEESKQEVKNVEQNVEIYFFGYEEETEPVILAKQYKNINDKINAQVINASERPDLMTAYGVESTDMLIAVASGQRYKVIDRNELYTYDMTTYQTIDVTEQKLTNAILDVTIAKKPQVYFLTGHGEFGISSSSYMYTIAQQITNEVNDVNTLDLLLSDMPETCDVLVIANPTKDFTDLETEKIENYINNGGNIVWMQDPYMFNEKQSDSINNINKILSLYGISFSKGVVCEQSSSNMLVGSPEIIIPEMNYNNIIKDIYTDGSIVMLDAGKINTADTKALENLGVTANAFLQSSSQSFYREDGASSIYQKLDTDEDGPFTLGTVMTKKVNEEKTSTLVAYSNAMFMTNYTIQLAQTYTSPVSLRNNRDLLLNTIASLTDREDMVRIRKDTGVVTYTATETGDRIVRIVIFTVPTLIIIVGITITIIRKRRNK